MKIIDEIKALWTFRSTGQQIYQEAKMPTVTGKPGWKTSTFWVKIFTVDMPVLYMGIKGFLPAKTAALIEVLAMGIYTIYRTIDGMTQQIQAVKLANGPVATTSGAETATATATVGPV